MTFLVYDGATPRDAHPLLDLIAQPNPREDRAGFLEAVAAHLLLAGNAYIEAVAVDGAVRELYALRPDRMRVVPGADGWAQAYEYTVGGRRPCASTQDAPLPPILHLTLFHPLDDHYGLAPLEAAAVAVDTHNAAARWNKALLDNAARPSGALVYTGPGRRGARPTSSSSGSSANSRTPTRAPPMPAGRCCWKAGSTGRRCRCRRRTWISWRPSTPPRARSRSPSACRRCCSAIPGDNTYSNYQEANRVFWRQTVLPLARRIGAALARWLAPAFGAGLRLVVDTDQIDALSADRAALWERVTKAPFLTLNEKRAMVGFGPVEGGDRIG